MKTTIQIVLIAVYFTILGCNAQNKDVFIPKIVYASEDLVITKISKNCYEHTSFLKTNDFGNVPCNGLIVNNTNEAIVFDTPTNDNNAETLIKWINDTLKAKIIAVIATHFHEDCLGGLQAFHNHNIASYAYSKTISFAKENKTTVPKNGFDNSIVLKMGTEKVVAQFFGEGHTKDNIVGYYPTENILFGGCLIKELNATKGYLGDANVKAWPVTVKKLKKAYPDVQLIIPGHGLRGDKKLLDYTIELFSNP